MRPTSLVVALTFSSAKNKLIDRAHLKELKSCDEIIDSILKISKSGYLNDSYLAIGFVRRLLGKLQGPKIIRFKNHQLGLTSSQVSEALASQVSGSPNRGKAKLTSKWQVKKSSNKTSALPGFECKIPLLVVLKLPMLKQLKTSVLCLLSKLRSFCVLCRGTRLIL